MALSINDATGIVHRTTNLVQGNSDYCCCFWFRPGFELGAVANYIAALALINAGYTAWAGVFSDNTTSPQTYEINVSNGGASTSSANHRVPADTNAHFGYRRSGTTHQFLVNGFVVGTATSDLAAVTFVDMLLGTDGFSVVNAPLLFWDFKEWNASNSVGTVRTEMANYGTVASALAFLRAFTPLVTDLLDDSGNGNHWLGAGNFSFVANPTLPLNVSPATATDMVTLPFTETVAETYNLPLWYKRTAAAGAKYIGGWGFGGLRSYEPAALVWTGDGTEEWPIDSAWQTVSLNKPFQTPQVPGQTFFYEFRSQFGGASGQLDVSFLPEPTETIPIGQSFLVTNESPGYGASVNSSLDGHVYQFHYPGIPSSEHGAGLFQGSGRVLIVALDNFYDSANLFLYEADLAPILTIPWATDEVIDATSNLIDQFYLAYNPPGAVEGYVLRMNENGVIDPTVIGSLPGTTLTSYVIAVNDTETILYYQAAGNNLGAIRAWDLVNNIALPDLVASPGVNWFGMGNLLSLPGGDLIGGFGQFLSGSQEFFRRYTPAGAVVWTYDTSVWQIDYHGFKLLHGFNFPDDVWLVGSLNGGHSVFIHLDTATGLEIGTPFEFPQFEIGVYAPVETATPEARFGPAPSCFYYMLRESIPVPPTGAAGCPIPNGPAVTGQNACPAPQPGVV